MASTYLELAMRDAGRIELRHQNGDRWTSGTFDDLYALRVAIRDRGDVGNLFTSLNRPRDGTPCRNEMGAAALCDSDMGHVVRMPIDFDPVRPVGQPSTEAELADAVAARDALVVALMGLGWPRPATAISGNGAHALYRLRIAATPEVVEMLSVIYRGLRDDFGTGAVHFDTTVKNPGRIWRLYGSTNRKGTATPDRPHRRAVCLIPARWEAVSPRQLEALAAGYAKQVQQPCAGARLPATSNRRRLLVGLGDYATLDVAGWFAAHDSYRRPLERGMHAVCCPWEAEHTTQDGEQSTATVVWEATGKRWPTLCCKHSHCDGRGIANVMQLWGDADAHCSSEWRAAS